MSILKWAGGLIGGFVLVCVLAIGGVTAVAVQMGGTPDTGLSFARGGFHFLGWGLGGTKNGLAEVGVGMEEMDNAAAQNPSKPSNDAPTAAEKKAAAKKAAAKKAANG